MATSFKRSQPCSRLLLTLASAGDSQILQASLGQSPVGPLLLSPGSWCTRFCLCQESASALLCKFWQLYGGVNGDLLQEGLCHPQSTADPLLGRHPNPVLSVSVGSLGPGAHKVCLSALSIWWEWGLILNVIQPLLPFQVEDNKSIQYVQAPLLSLFGLILCDY